MSSDLKYRMRFRFRLGMKLTCGERRLARVISGHEVVLAPQIPETPISQSDWLVMNARGFETEDIARSFGHKLKASLELSAAITRLGADGGLDVPTSGLGLQFKENFLEETGLDVRANVHGVDVFVDSPSVRFTGFEAIGKVTHGIDPFLSNLDVLMLEANKVSQQSKDIILLLNFALLRPEPVAQIVFAISAVEMLGQQETWSKSQRELINRLACESTNAAEGTRAERQEVADAIKRGLNKIGLRQGVLRLLDSLDLAYLRGAWDSVYGQRSKLVHGLAPQPGARYEQLASETLNLCGRILLTAVARDLSAAARHLDQFYPTQ